MAPASPRLSALAQRLLLLQAVPLGWTLERTHAALRERVGVRLDRDPQPSAAKVDSQSVKMIGMGGEPRGYDRGKKASLAGRHRGMRAKC